MKKQKLAIFIRRLRDVLTPFVHNPCSTLATVILVIFEGVFIFLLLLLDVSIQGKRNIRVYIFVTVYTLCRYQILLLSRRKKSGLTELSLLISAMFYFTEIILLTL